ncbi:MAG: DNA polymerase IV [Candidatus Omnitrophota bacterium]
MQSERYIVHVDMDAFFASIEQRDNPSLGGKPVIVGADPQKGRGRGVVAASSYEARKFGIHSAMPISTAYQKCPHAAFLLPDMQKYSEVSRHIYKILYDFTPEIEPVSIDEAFLNITGSYKLFGTPQKTCLLIKSSIKKETLLTASIGLAPTKMAAKIASDLEKPDGLVRVSRKNLLDFLWPLDIKRLWGLGKKTEAVLKDRGISTIGELAKKDVKEIMDLLGKNGLHLWQLANGIDDSEVLTDSEAKSLSSETTFDKDTSDRDQVEAAIMSLCEKVSARLRCEGLKAKTVTLKIRLEGFLTYTRALTLGVSTNHTDILYKYAKELYAKFDTFDGPKNSRLLSIALSKRSAPKGDPQKKKIRLIGVKASNLISSRQKDYLFKDFGDEKREMVHQALDRIRERFGSGFIRRAGGLRH